MAWVTGELIQHADVPRAKTSWEGSIVESTNDTQAGKPKKNVLLLVSLVLGALYVIYSLWYWFGGGAASQAGADSASQAGAGLAAVIVMPHLALTVLAVVFNALGLFMNKAGFALTAGILYAVAMVLFPVYFFFVIVEMTLCFVAYAKLHKQQKDTAQ